MPSIFFFFQFFVNFSSYQGIYIFLYINQFRFYWLNLWMSLLFSPLPSYCCLTACSCLTHSISMALTRNFTKLACGFHWLRDSVKARVTYSSWQINNSILFQNLPKFHNDTIQWDQNLCDIACYHYHSLQIFANLNHG